MGLIAVAIGSALASPAPAAQPSVAQFGAMAGAAELSGGAEERAADPAAAPTQVTGQVIDWVVSSRDNGRLPFIVIDKVAAAMFVFDARGQLAGAAPALLGIASGDDSTPGIGERNLSEIGPAERTTPAGRFVARFGPAYGGHTVLWVDFANSVAIHPVITSNARERRAQRLASSSAEDNRITFGCINVPAAFYRDVLEPLFSEAGGIVYILPETRPFEDVFPRMQVASAIPQPGPPPQRVRARRTTSFSIGR
ncbi:MAG TPA: hypothetical protein VEW04_03610 [Allosphingosinicella sp.]|nr:hypothetical protein [Allosphingosinicella sp.]